MLSGMNFYSCMIILKNRTNYIRTFCNHHSKNTYIYEGGLLFHPIAQMNHDIYFYFKQ